MAITAAYRSAAEPEIKLTRAFRQPIDKVWSALSTPGRLAEWMGVEWLGETGPLFEGAAFHYRFANTEMESRGRVLRFEPPRVLEHSWFDDVTAGTVVRWELAPEGDGCRLTLTHRFGTPEDAPRTAAGWTLLLESLAGSLGEGDAAKEGGKEGWRALRDSYATAFPAEATRDGRRVEIDGVTCLRFERRLAGPVERVWAALIDPESLHRWMQAEAVVEPRIGGRFSLGLDGGRYAMEGRITQWSPSRLLEYSWTEAEANGDSLVRFELSEAEQACRLVLTHILTRGGKLDDFASGWHWHLDALERALAGETVTVDRARIAALGQVYAATL